NDANHEVRTYAGWNTATNTPTGPTEVSRDDLTGTYTETLTMSAAPPVSGGRPDGNESIASLQTLSREVVNGAGQAIHDDRRVNQSYFDWRDRPVAEKDGVQGTEDTTTHRPILYYMYNNLDEVTTEQQYDGDQVSITSSGGVPQAPSSSLLRAQTVHNYDDQG